MAEEQRPIIFIGSSSEAADFAEGFQLNLEHDGVVKVWNQIDWGLSRSTFDTLDQQAEQADFAIFVFAPDDQSNVRGEQVSTTRDNVLLELGLFIGRLGRDRVFIAIPSGLKERFHIPSDLLGLTALSFDLDSYDPAFSTAKSIMGSSSAKIRAVMRRLKRLKRSASAKNRRIRGVLERGDTSWITILADAAIHVADPRHEYPLELKRRIVNNELLPMKYLYWTPQGSSHWLRVCQRQSYTLYRESVTLLREKAREVASHVVKALGTSEVDFVSVGSGDGVKDNLLLRAFAEHLDEHSFAYYYPVDISDALIVQAIPTALGNGLDRTKFRVKALIADFEQLPALQRFYEERPAKNLFAVLGNSIGNADEAELLASLDRAMLDGDLVLLEVNCAKASLQDPALRELVSMEHDFTPLASLNVNFEAEKIDYELARDLSVVPEAETIITLYRDAEIGGLTVRNIKLAVVHHYRLDAFQKTMEARLTVKTIARYERGSVGLILAQRI